MQVWLPESFTDSALRNWPRKLFQFPICDGAIKQSTLHLNTFTSTVHALPGLLTRTSDFDTLENGVCSNFWWLETCPRLNGER